ncbi:hypothetical protein KR084_002886 [Drosophila pseudotakahashii]|nr:hypothetical protein KR084_002886 [Drosophila pseudotakahashii]
MLKTTTFFLFAYFVLDIQGSLDARRYVCLLSDPQNQCSAYCVSSLQSVIDHIGKEQHNSNTCEIKLNETQAKLDQMADQLRATQIQMKGQQTSLLTNLTQAIPQDLQERLDRIEGQLTAMQDTLSKLDREFTLVNYERIGTRLYYFEHHLWVDWYIAEKLCIESGGHLAAFNSEQEFNEVTRHLKQEHYWLGLSDPKQNGEFTTVASGKRAPYLKWGSDEPNYHKIGQSDEHCAIVYGVYNYMLVFSCQNLMHFICQADKIYY